MHIINAYFGYKTHFWCIFWIWNAYLMHILGRKCPAEKRPAVKSWMTYLQNDDPKNGVPHLRCYEGEWEFSPDCSSEDTLDAFLGVRIKRSLGIPLLEYNIRVELWGTFKTTPISIFTYLMHILIQNAYFLHILATLNAYKSCIFWVY